MARIVKLSDGLGAAIDAAVNVLKEGGVIVFPTETSYGLGTDALNAKAVEKVHNAKEQPLNKPISVVVASVEQAKEIAKVGENAEKLIHNFMPGPLTLVCKKNKGVPDALSKESIAFRIPGHEFAMALAKGLGRAVTATSANIHDKPAIYSGKEAVEVFGEVVDLIVDAGDLPKQEASTIFSCVDNRPLREGPVSREGIEKVLSQKIE